VAEEVFEALWRSGRRSEARDVARMAGRRDWITPHMFETINRADHGSTNVPTSFKVTARAEVEPSAIVDGWPAEMSGYTTALTVVACDEAEARELAVTYLRDLDPGGIRFDLHVAPVLPEDVASTRIRGVARIEGSRLYFRGPQV
jgi:hypothetical protein